MPVIVKTGAHKGKPTLSLLRSPTDSNPFTLTLNRAKLIVLAIEHIKAFIAKYDNPLTDSSVEESCGE